jgi:MOB kinase activator 1
MDVCTVQSCPCMRAGRKVEYKWTDDDQSKPVRLPARVYIDKLMSWVESQITNERIFPLEEAATFPPNFSQVIGKIFRRLFRIYAHLYHEHKRAIITRQVEAHLNTCFKHCKFRLSAIQ